MRLVLLIILLLPLAAHAEPVTAAVATWLGVSATTAAVIIQIGITVAATVYGSAQQRKAKKRARDKYNASLQDRLLTSVATESPHVYVYGRAKVGSRVVAIFTSGNKDQYKHLVCVHADHECDAFEEIYVAGKKLSANRDANGWAQDGEFTSSETKHGAVEVPTTQTSVTLPRTPVAGSVGVILRYSDGWDPWPFSVSGTAVTISPPPEGYTGGSYKFVIGYNYVEVTSRVRVTTHLGYPGEPADAYLISAKPDKWTSSHTLSGKCYSVVTLDLNEAEFQGGIPSIEVVLRGKRLYDFRTGETAWSDNAALAVHDYLTSEMCGVGATDLPLSQFIHAANVCDQAYWFGKRYTINGTVTADEDQSGVLERMAQAMAGTIVSTTWDVQAGAYVAPVMALNQSDIVGALAITPGMSDADIYNGVRGQFISGENGYIATDFKPYQNGAYLAADGREMWTNIDFPFTDSLQRVHNLCRIFTEDQRNGYTVKAEFSLKAWKLKVGNRVTLTSELFGWSSKIFRVTDKRFSPSGMVELTLKEDSESIWNFSDEVLVDATPNTGLPNPFYVAPPASLSWTSGTDDLLIASDGTIISRIHAKWPVVQLAVGLVEVEWQLLGSGIWQKAQVNSDETEGYLYPVQDGAFYVVRARCFDPYLNRRSDWVYAPTARVIGKTEPPPDITDLSISGTVLNWSAVTALDLKGYVFRFHYGNNRDWNSAAPLHTGVIAGAPFDLVARPGGLVTIMGKAVDTSGNESNAAALVVTDLGDPTVANVVEEFDLHAAGFPGELGGGAVVSGDLVANFTDSAYGTDNQSFYGADNDPAYDISTYSQLIYTSGEISVAGALAGSVMTVQIDSAGRDLTIEYRLAGPGPAYGADSDSAYTDEQLVTMEWGLISDPVAADDTLDLGLITEAATQTYDLRGI